MSGSDEKRKKEKLLDLLCSFVRKSFNFFILI